MARRALPADDWLAASRLPANSPVAEVHGCPLTHLERPESLAVSAALDPVGGIM
jgi:hypothetical protein